MKIEIIEKKKEIAFPWIGVSQRGCIVLFVGHGKGVTINSTNHHSHGEYIEDWLMLEFKPFTGTITLSND